jgi:hypothetical protein
MNHPTKAAWRKSTFCNGADACVEVAPLANGNVALRDGKDPDAAPQVYSPAEWEAFTSGVKAGEFNLAALTVSAGDGSGVDGPGSGLASTLPGSGGDSVPA